MQARQAQSDPQPHPCGRSPALLWLGAFLVAFVLYAGTSNRGVQWQDSGWQQYRIATGTIDHARGLALTHPLEYYLGRIAIATLPFEPAFCTTLVSAFAASVAVGNTLLLLTLLTRRRLVAAICTIALMLSHTFWQSATHTESYTLVLALLSAEWLCLLNYARTGNGKWLLGVGLFNGLGIANHMLATLALPVDLIIVILAVRRKHMTPRFAFATAAIWVLGTLPYSVLVLRTALATGDFGAAIHSALFGEYAEGVLNTKISLRSLALSAGYMLYNFPGLTLPLAAHAVFRKVDAPRLFLIAVRCQLAVFLIFVVRYAIVDQFTFYLPVYGMLTVLAGVGLSDCMTRFKPVAAKVIVVLALVTSLWTPLVYSASRSVLASRGAFKGLVGNKPYRDGYAAFFTPWGLGDNHAAVLNRTAMDLAGPSGVIVLEDSMMYHALLYAQHVEPGVDQANIILSPSTKDRDARQALHQWLLICHNHNQTIVLVPRDRDAPNTLEACCAWQREGDIYILREISAHCE